MLQSSVKEGLMVAEPPPMFKVAGLTGEIVVCDFDCNEKNKKPMRKVFCMKIGIGDKTGLDLSQFFLEKHRLYNLMIILILLPGKYLFSNPVLQINK